VDGGVVGADAANPVTLVVELEEVVDEVAFTVVVAGTEVLAVETTCCRH
jgi:hypothetical protein